MILIIPEHISKNVCSELIEVFQNNRELSTEWRCTSPIQIQEIDDDDEFLICKRVSQFICNSCIPTFGPSNYIECAQLVEWPINCFQNSHVDDQRDHTSMVSLTYLNDDFVGGNTILDDLDLSIKPSIGKTIFFDGMKHRHSVSKITSGTRYTLALWYTKDISQSIPNF